MKSKRIISIFELTLIILSSFAFAYFVSTDLPDVFEKESSVIQFLTKPMIPIVSAIENLPTGCCKETITGAKCQDVLVVDKAICKTDLIGTACSTVSECQRGCCYDSDSGICSLNAPKESCTIFGGKWDQSSTCNIPECQVGCCILGDGAAMTSTRECTKLANEFQITKVFKPLDAKGSCDLYSDLKEVGACLTESNDYSGLKSCIFTTKSNCNRANQEFKKDYLCTSKELKTNCEKTTKTSCFDGDDRVYFVDSCGNKANVYDSFKGKNQTYWEKIIAPSASCNGPAEFCGNCDYNTGNICTKYVTGKNLIKPELGDYVCKNLDCVGGRKHGESWCISDANNNKEASAGVGTRNYVASCFEGEIKLEGCADFNQEICIENKEAGTKKSDAMCVINDWRSCIYANDATSYFEVKTRCSALPQCTMFDEIPGNEKYNGLPGFKKINNNEQGRAGNVGTDLNDVMTYCVPRFTPGFQFWTTSILSNPFTGGRTESSATYGGSQSETNSICALGSFTCVSHIKTVSSIAGGSTSTDWENPECNFQAVDQSKQKVNLMMDALNDRCRSLGSCGIQYNAQGELGRSGFTVNRVYLDKKGNSHSGYTTAGYNVTSSYLAELKKEQSGNEMGTATKLESLTSWKGGASLLTGFGSEFGKSGSMITKAFASSGMLGSDSSGAVMGIVGSVGALATLGATAGIGTYAAGTAIPAGTSLAAGSTVASEASIASGTYTVTTSGATGATTTTVGASGSGTATTGATGATAGSGGATTSTGAFASGALSAVALAAVAFVVGSYIGQLMSKGMPPGEAKVNTAAWAGGTVVATMLIAYGGYLLGLWEICVGPQVIICAIIAILAIIYAVFTKGVDHEYYVTEFKCEAWQPPLTGKCEECNNDVRSCSEFKCRSLGNNCHYFVDNGEPGYCATLNDVWSAKIEPWKEKITPGNEYSNVSSAGFRVENKQNSDNAVNAWQPIIFGIVTDKEAVCKIDVNHSKNYDQMRYVMASEMDYSTGKVDGKHHMIALSPHAILGENNQNMETTIPMEEGDNEYYIICQNYAGLTNDAPFVVQVKQAEGPDMTPPLIVRFAPENNGYLAQDTKDLQLFVYLNEPSECRYSFDSYNIDWGTANASEVTSITQENEEIIIGAYDSPVQTINKNSASLSCITDPNAGYYGEWMCAAFISNYTTNKKIYLECKDQPELIEEGLNKRNTVRAEYGAQICETGLKITSIEPTGKIETSANAPVNLKVSTEGCINGGDAACSFRLPYYGNVYSLMLNTGNKTHEQPFTSLGQGTRDVEVSCEDSAGNIATARTNFTVFIDDVAPQITRIYVDSDTLIMRTDENAECLFSTNETLGCDFGFETAPGKYSDLHTVKIDTKSNDKFLIKCRDSKGNIPTSGCTTELKLSSIQQ